MSADSIVMLVVLVGVAVALVLDRFAPVVVLAGGIVVLLFARVIDAEVALSGLSSPAPATIAALYIVAGAATATGAFGSVVDRLLESRRPLASLTAATAGLSAVMPNTPLVAMFAPKVVRWSHRQGNSASRYLLPLSYASILGGVITLIGTSTNLVVSDLLVKSGAEPLGVFEVTAVGLPIAVVGVAVLTTLSVRLLPERRSAPSDGALRAREFQMAARVDPDGPMAGATIADSGLRSLDGVFLAMIERPTPDGGVTTMRAQPDLVLHADDLCCFVGDAGGLIDLHAMDGLVGAENQHVVATEGPGTCVFEAVIAPGSTLVGRSLSSADFRRRYGGAVMAIHRADATLGGQLGRISLRGGDVLLLLADDGFERRWRSDSDFSLVAVLEGPVVPRRGRAFLVIAAAACMVVAAATGVLPLLEAAIAAAGVVVIGGALTRREAWSAVNLDVVLTMSAAISLGTAVASTGLAGEIALVVGRVASGGGELAAVLTILLATMVLTELLSNSAAAALMVPVALSVAVEVDVPPRMLAITVLVGASCSFLSPVGYQTNLMVFGLGGYRFSDFPRVGAPLNLVTVAIAAIVIPAVYG